MNTRRRVLAAACGLLCALLMPGASDVKADAIVITFDDVDTSAGPQRIDPNRYGALGVEIRGQAEGEDNPLVGPSANAASSPNFAFTQRHPGEFGDSGLSVVFYLPGTTTRAATGFVSFSAVNIGTTAEVTARFFGFDPVEGFIPLGSVNGTGNTTLTFSTDTSQIHAFVFHLHGSPNVPPDSIIGIDNLTFNTPQTPVPEPGTIVLLGTGLAGVAARAIRRRRHREKSRRA